MIKPRNHPLRIAVVEDRNGFRDRLVELLNGREGWRCVSVCRDGEEALRQLPGEEPDLVLVDILLPGISGLEVVGRLKPKMPQTDFVMLTVVDNTDDILQAIHNGASGYILKGGSSEEILSRITDAADGAAGVSPAIARKILDRVRDHKLSQPHPDFGLTGREWELLKLAARGKQQGQIAELLGISVFTVKAHFRNIYDKLGVKSRAQAVLLAFSSQPSRPK